MGSGARRPDALHYLRQAAAKHPDQGSRQAGLTIGVSRCRTEAEGKGHGTPGLARNLRTGPSGNLRWGLEARTCRTFRGTTLTQTEMRKLSTLRI